MISHKIIKYVEPVRQNRVFPFQTQAYTLTQADVDAHLINHPFKVGDWVVFRGINNMSTKLTADKCSIVTAINTDASKIDHFKGVPKTYLLMQLTGTSEYCRGDNYKFSRDPWCRWDDGIGMVRVEDAEVARMTDDYVQTYLKDFLPRAASFIR